MPLSGSSVPSVYKILHNQNKIMLVSLLTRSFTGVVVDELVKGGNAEKSGNIRVGDILKRCSAVVLKDGTEGQFEKEVAALLWPPAPSPPI